MAEGIYNRMKIEMMEAGLDLFGDQIRVALMDNVHAFDPDNNVFGDVSANELPSSGTGYTSGGELLANKNTTQDDSIDKAVFDADDVVINSATFTAYHAVVYDVDVGNTLLGSFDFGGAKQVIGGTFTIQWASTGIITLS